MCSFETLRRCARTKRVWCFSIISLIIIVTIFGLNPDLRQPRNIAIAAYAFLCSVSLSCCMVWCSNPSTAGSISSLPTYEDAIAQDLTQVTVHPKAEGLPLKLDYKDELPKKSALVDLQKEPVDQYLPSYHEAVSQPRISNDDVELGK